MEKGFATALQDAPEGAAVGEPCGCFSPELEAALASTARYRQRQLMLHVDWAELQWKVSCILSEGLIREH